MNQFVVTVQRLLAELLPRVSLRGLLTIAQGWQLRIRYYTASRRVIGWRIVSPLALRPLYFDAFCLRCRETLTFCLARILAVESATIGGSARTTPTRCPRQSGWPKITTSYRR